MAFTIEQATKIHDFVVAAGISGNLSASALKTHVDDTGDGALILELEQIAAAISVLWTTE